MLAVIQKLLITWGKRELYMASTNGIPTPQCGLFVTPLDDIDDCELKSRSQG